MKSIIDFWKKDIINKLIVIVLLALIIGAFGSIYFLFTIPNGSTFYSGLLPFKTTVPTQTSTATLVPTPTTELFASLTPLPLPTSTGASSSSLTPFVATPIIFPTATQSQFTPTVITTSTAVAANSTLSSTTALACIPNNSPQTGNVVGVLDGNTIKVLLDSDGKIHVIRYIGIAVPKYGETQELYGNAAEIANYNLVFAKKVNLYSDVSDMDSAGRLLRYVTVGDDFINVELLQHGWATAASTPPNTACDSVFKNAEQTAHQAHVGRWMVVASTPSSP
jgi:endonuclease YncB( thermonuclease family)